MRTAILATVAALATSATAQLVSNTPTDWVAGPTATNPRACVLNPAAGVNYFPDRVAKNGTAWTIEYRDTFKIVRETFTAGKNRTYVLYQCGTTQPDAAAFPGATFFSIPLQNVATLSTTELAYLELLGARNTIKYTTNRGLISSPCIYNANLTSITTYNETVAEGQAFLAAYNNVNATIVGASDSLPAGATGKTLVFPAVSDQTKYGRSEWLLFLSAFFNAEKEANAAVKKIQEQYKCIADAAANAKTTYGSPDATWGDFYTSKPPVTFYLGAPYKYQYLADAGAVFAKAGKGNTGTSADAVTATDLTTTSETVKNLISNSELFFTSGFVKDQADLLAALDIAAADEAKYNVTQTKQAWSSDKRIGPAGTGMAWFQTGVVYQHVVLADLASIIQPGLFKDYTRTFFRNVASESQSPVNVGQCDNANNPLQGALVTVPDVACPTLTGTATDWKAAGAGGTSGTGNAAGRMGVSALLTIALTVVGSVFCLL